MMKLFSNCESRSDLKAAALLYIMDMSYDRGDISSAIKATEISKGW